MRPGRTDGLHVHALQLGTARQGLLHAHVAGDAPGARGVVDGDQALPLLHGDGHLPRDAQPLLLHLGLWKGTTGAGTRLWEVSSETQA